MSECSRKLDKLTQLNQELQQCTLCPLSNTRIQAILGAGSPMANILIVGEAPGATEDQLGLPFCGRSGTLLTKLLGEVGLKKEEIFITNICRCRPPNNRNPVEEEITACLPHLDRTIKIINPDVLLTLGRFASQILSKSLDTISKLRIREDLYYTPPYLDILPCEQIKIFSTFHPAYLLRQSSKLHLVLKDLQKMVDYVRNK